MSLQVFPAGRFCSVRRVLLLWLLTGNFAKRGAQYMPAAIQSLFGSGASSQRSPVAGAPIISGLVPCNVIAREWRSCASSPRS